MLLYLSSSFINDFWSPHLMGLKKVLFPFFKITLDGIYDGGP